MRLCCNYVCTFVLVCIRCLDSLAEHRFLFRQVPQMLGKCPMSNCNFILWKSTRLSLSAQLYCSRSRAGEPGNKDIHTLQAMTNLKQMTITLSQKWTQVVVDTKSGAAEQVNSWGGRAKRTCKIRPTRRVWGHAPAGICTL